jgi:methionine synthase II (cobalamin-independent)
MDLIKERHSRFTSENDRKVTETMEETFRPGGLPVLIGSLPLDDHEAAARLVFRHTPEIPLWVQLPVFPKEGMIAQFMPGLPGLATVEGRTCIDTSAGNFAADLAAFYEDYLAVTDGGATLDGSRFALTPDMARGFYVFMDHVAALKTPPVALKGQVTGPITFTTAVKDQAGRAVFYDESVRDAAVKLLAENARWQIRQLSRFGRPVILFIDEPALAGFGSSEFISISKADVAAALGEVIDAVHAEGGLAGIHVCANTEWDLIIDTPIDIVNFDAYTYFDRFILYGEAVRRFLEAGRIIAWGIVPTSEAVANETGDALAARWEDQAAQVRKLGFDRERILSQTLITPSCGTGSLSREHAVRVLDLTRTVSRRIRGIEVDR